MPLDMLIFILALLAIVVFGLWGTVFIFLLLFAFREIQLIKERKHNADTRKL